MFLYKVTVRFPTVTPLYQEQDFLFYTKEEAVRFTDMIEAETDWEFRVPTATNTPEVFEADSAFMWIKDEIEATKRAVNASPSSYPSSTRLAARSA